MWRKPHRLDGILSNRLSFAGPLLCLLYEDEADRRHMLSRIEQAGLGRLPRVMMSVGSEPATPIPAIAGDCERQPARVA